MREYRGFFLSMQEVFPSPFHEFIPRLGKLAGRPRNTFLLAMEKVLEGLRKKRGGENIVPDPVCKNTACQTLCVKNHII